MKSKDNAAGFGILAILILLVLLPLAAVLFQVVCPGLQIEKFDPSNLKLVLDVFVRPLWKKAFFNSFFLSIGTTVIGLLLAAFLAHVRVRYSFFGARFLDIVSWILMIVPSFILAQGWVYFASGNGIASAWLGIEGVGGFVFSYWGLVCVMVFALPAFADGDPLTVINNLSTFIFSLIRAVGLILLGWGIVQVGLSLQSHDPSQRSQGFLTLAGGLVITFAKEILDLITA